MRFLSLFSGIEAVSVAWQDLGWECVGFSEIEPFPCSLLAYHYPDVPNLGDITKITEQQIADLGNFDLMVFGFPCQEVSIAGSRVGFGGNRSVLFYEALRIFDYARKHNNCRFAMFENVPGIFSVSKGEVFATVVREMAGLQDVPIPTHGWGNSGVALGENGLLEWRVLDAQYFGLAQRRKRVFAILDTGDWYDRPPILFEQESMRGDTPPSRTQGSETTTSTKASVGKCSESTLAFQTSYNNVAVKDGITPPILATQGTTGNKGVYVCHGSQHPISNADELANCLGRNNGTENVVCFEQHYDKEVVRVVKDDVSSTLTSGMGMVGTNYFYTAYATHADQTPKISQDVAYSQVAYSQVAYDKWQHADVACTLKARGGVYGGGAENIVVDGQANTYGFNPKFQNSREELAQTLTTTDYKDPKCEAVVGVSEYEQTECVAIAGNIIGRQPEHGGNQAGFNVDDVSYTLTDQERHAIACNYVVRRLTVTECERLMGFPDDYTAVLHNGKLASNSARYKALGNSMAVSVMKWIGERIVWALNQEIKAQQRVFEAMASGQTTPKSHDPINHPSHYTSHPSGIECITITKHHNFCIGNAIKYLWRAGLKDGNSTIQDLQKAVWYINKEIESLGEK